MSGLLHFLTRCGAEAQCPTSRLLRFPSVRGDTRRPLFSWRRFNYPTVEGWGFCCLLVWWMNNYSFLVWSTTPAPFLCGVITGPWVLGKHSPFRNSSVLKPTGCSAIEVRNEKIEGRRNRRTCVKRVDNDAKKSVGFSCPHCPDRRPFPTQVGLSLHLTRWCKNNPSGAGGEIPPMAAHSVSLDQAQNHVSGWSYARIHNNSEPPSDALNSIQTRPYLKLPNASNKGNGKN